MDAVNPTLNPASLSIADAARMLSRVGQGRITEAMLETDVAAGAPTNPDGTLHLVQYTAWLLKEIPDGD